MSKAPRKPDQYPEYDFPEIAFAGRSNVGKSSLINTLIQRKDMVKTSSRPGCTQLINFFLVNQALLPCGPARAMDMPRCPKRSGPSGGPWLKNTCPRGRTCLGLILLVDIRREVPVKRSLSWPSMAGGPRHAVSGGPDQGGQALKDPAGQAAQGRDLHPSWNRDKNGVILFSAKTRQGRDDGSG